MGQKKIDALFSFLLLSLMTQLNAQAAFEDAEKLSDLVSSGQHFDLRHTIPGIPEVDYPIYREVPETSFLCTGRHEGYYADIESRCQAFRICTHTARSVHGFGFLCPNGTLFNQKYFVCDWYRNVNCDDSERFYSKNDVNRVGSSFDMMETVRQMIEYPMKTITKALQSNPASSRQPTQRTRTINKSALPSNDTTISESEVGRLRGRPASGRKSVTRDQVESAHNRGSAKYGREKATRSKEESAKNNENVGYNRKNPRPNKTQNESALSRIIVDDVYVNSLGELSTDPGVVFDRTNAHIIAEPRRQRYQNRMNFAQKVNAGLNDLMGMPSNETMAPDYIKLLRDSSTETPKIDLSSNINGLLDEIANDLEPGFPGYPQQKPAKGKHGFRFLSRGFSSQNDPYKYIRPKQTPSTVRFTPNQLRIEDGKSSKKQSLELPAEDVPPFGYSTIKPESTETTNSEHANDYETPTVEVPTLDDASYLSPPILESTSVTSAPTDEATETTTTPNGGDADTISSGSLGYAAAIGETTTQSSETDSSKIESAAISDIARNLVAPPVEDRNQKLNAEETPVDEERIDVNKQAARLFISGLHLTKNENTTEAVAVEGAETTQPPLLIHVPDDHSYLTDWVSSTLVPTTDAATTPPLTTTEIPPESGSLQARLRNYRRLSNLQRAKAKPLVYGKRAGVRTNSNTSTTTPKPTATTISYLKRVAASRLRLSRLAAAAGNKPNTLSFAANPALQPVDNALDPNSNKKLITRNIDKETAGTGNNLFDSKTDKTDKKVPTWESVKNSLQRFQTNNKDMKSNDEPTTPATADKTTPNSTSSTTARSPFPRMRNRASLVKTQQPKTVETTSEPTTPVATSTSVSVSSSSSSSTSTSRSSSSSIFSKFLPLSLFGALQDVTPSPPPAQSTPSVESSQNRNAITTLTTPASSHSFPHGATADNTNLNSNSATAPDPFISFDKLTRSIVDASILQTYRAGPILGRLSPNDFQSSLSSISRNDFGRVSLAPASPVFAQNAPTNFGQQPELSQQTQHTRPQNGVHLPAAPISPTPTPTTTTGPPVFVASALGERIAPNNVSSIISSIINQQKKSNSNPTPKTSYEPLNDFLKRTFSSFPKKSTPLETSPNFNTPFPQQQQPQYSQQQVQHQQQQPQGLQYTQSTTQQIQQNSQQQYQQNRQQYQQIPQQLFQSQHQPQYQLNQQRNSHISLAQQLNPSNNIYQSTANFVQQSQLPALLSQLPPTVRPTLSSLLTQNIFETFKQQQQQLPAFPPLAAAPPTPSQNPARFDDTNNFLNVQLPSLPNGLIPTPNNQIAQKRSDISTDELEYTDLRPEKPKFTGASSYDVPLNSIGRLPNDKQALFYLRY